MNIRTLIRRGRFNLMNPQEEQINVHLRCGEMVVNANFSVEDGEHLLDWREESILALAEECLALNKEAYLWSGVRKELEELIAHLTTNENAVMRAYWNQRIEYLEGKQKALADQLAKAKDELQCWEE